MSLAAAAASTETPVIEVPAGGTAVVIVDVNEMVVPYCVRYAGVTVIKAKVDRAEPLPLVPGDKKLLWSFTHEVKGWKHVIGLSINDGQPIVLESCSEKNKDPEVSTDFVVIRTLTE